MTSESRVPVLEKLVAEGFVPTPDFASYNLVLYVKGKERVFYDKMEDVIIKRYESKQ